MFHAVQLLSSSIFSLVRFLSCYGACLCWVFLFVADRRETEQIWSKIIFFAIALSGVAAVVSRCRPLWKDGGDFILGTPVRGRRFTAREVVALRTISLLPSTTLLRVTTGHFAGYTILDTTKLAEVLRLLQPASGADESRNASERSVDP